MPADVSRADLLRVLAHAPAGQAAAIARLLGWERAPRQDGAAPLAAAKSAPAETSPTPAPLLYRSRPAPRYWRLERCEPIETDDSAAGGDAESDEDTASPAPPSQYRLPDALLNAGQWQNLWDRLTPSNRPGRALDLPACVRRLTRGEPLGKLPRRPRRGFNRAVTLMLDWSEAIAPVRADLLQARDTLARLLGDQQALQTLSLPAGPGGYWDDWQGGGCSGPGDIANDALVVLIGSFGPLDSADIAPDWQALLDRLRGAGHALLLVPVRALRQRAIPSMPLDPALLHGDSARAGHALETLLTALSRAWSSPAARLRDLRRAIPEASLHTELSVWCHREVDNDGVHLNLKPGLLPMRQERYERLRPATRRRLDAVHRDWQGGLDPGARDIEALQRQLTRGLAAERFPGLVRQAKRAAEEPHAAAGMPHAQLCSMAPIFDELARHGPHPSWRHVLSHVRQATGRTAPPGPQPPRSLVQLGRDLIVRTGPDGLLPMGQGAYSVETGQLVDGAALLGLDALEVIDRGYSWTLEPTTRPAWAERIWSDAGRLFAAHAENALFVWEPAAPDRPEGAWLVQHNPWPWASDLGVDGYGLWARLEVGGAGQRMRWILPGRFLMGSPEDEPERFDNETQHSVELTQGFWLGETAVPQALWAAVMGENPSDFQGDDLPVEQVSWNGCQGFLAKLGARLPGFHPALPSEAQWEYACRAGTRTPFSFGADLDTTKANYDGDFPYAGGPKGEDRGRTLPVRSFEPNPWGLYQMHGNVWVWCADWFGAYPEGEATDPTGPAGGRRGVLRGGSWFNFGRLLRSAFRLGYEPDIRYRSIGLRLAGGFGPQASQASQPAAGAGAMTTDGRDQRERQGGGQGDGAGGRPG